MPPIQQRGRQGRQLDSNIAHCCLPGGCARYEEDPIREDDPKDAVKVTCNNADCTVGSWMHADCFDTWEQQVLAYLRSCGRARSWSERQRLQNLWTKKGYDLAYKSCDCKCAKGHLRKNLDYIPPVKPVEAVKSKKKNKKKATEKCLPVVLNNMQKGTSHHNPHSASSGSSASSRATEPARPELRVRTSSISSTGSSPPSSAGTPPLTPGGNGNKKFEFFADVEQAAAGNIFRRRTDFSAFSVLPRYQQNPYHIKMEDEGPYGNDEIRCFVLSNLSTHQVTAVQCVTCQMDLPVYDKYPIIDGTFFLSPKRYNTDLQVLSDHKMMYLNAVCMWCMEGARNIRCLACKRPWSGSTLVLGTMYAYDIFAAMPCCGFRLTCKSCKHAILDPSCTFNYYSQYSQPIQCPFCKTEDHHFIKSLPECFYISKQSICKA